MYQRDYVLRLIEMAARTLAAILGHIKGGDTNWASEELEMQPSRRLHRRVISHHKRFQRHKAFFTIFAKSF